jgi:hypothetical protein
MIFKKSTPDKLQIPKIKPTTAHTATTRETNETSTTAEEESKGQVDEDCEVQEEPAGFNFQEAYVTFA